MYVFIGIETPSSEALKESRKFQTLRSNNVDQTRIIQKAGLWILAGFTVGFNSDDETTFQRQLDFIELTNITWAMAGVLQALAAIVRFFRHMRQKIYTALTPPHAAFAPGNTACALEGNKASFHCAGGRARASGLEDT